MRFSVGFGTDIGLRRNQNQDSGASFPDLGLFVVADGMGGHRGGEIASSMSVEVIPDVVRKAQDRSSDWNPRTILNEAVQRANFAVYERSIRDSELQGMGTTVTAILFKDDLLTIGHVGDSRAYFYRDGILWQLTRDHSLVQEKLRAGLITREQARTDQMRNVITRSVGFGHETVVEIYQKHTRPGDIYMLCSDGLSGQVEDHVVADSVSEFAIRSRDLMGAVNHLIQLSNEAGGQDNTTVILVQVNE